MILVVDDEIAVLSIAHAMLTRYGYTVITAHSGKEALRALEVWPEMPIQLALIDLVMPEMNGAELAERIRSVRPGLPVLFFSAYSESEPLRPQHARGVPFIAKPFTSIQLVKKIREALDEPKADAASEQG
jgi:two-component system, cell cycle sensor histidine kinase and response regulator CckA